MKVFDPTLWAKKIRWIVFAGILSVLLGIGVLQGSIQAVSPGGNPNDIPAKYSALFQKAQTNGRIPVIVGFKTGFELGQLEVSLAERQAISQAQGRTLQGIKQGQATSVKKFTYIPYMALEVDEKALADLISQEGVISIEEDIAVPPTLSDTIPLIGAEDAWAGGYSGAGQVIAILDTGVDKNHPFLAGKVVSEACYSSNTATSSTLCPNGQVQQIGSGAGVNCSIAGCYHGTHVAGIAAGKGSDFSGVAKDANIIAIQVFSNFSGDVRSRSSDQILGLERVYNLRNAYNIAAANMSLGGGRNTSPCDGDSRKSIIDLLKGAGIATVISSGNDSYSDAISSPGCISSAVSVGATTKSDQVASFSNSASFLDLLAPVEDVNSSVPGGRFIKLDGTSMAAPHVAGAWAILQQKSPQSSVDEILSALANTGKPIWDNRNNITKPRIQVGRAIGVEYFTASKGTVASTTDRIKYVFIKDYPGDPLASSVYLVKRSKVEMTASLSGYLGRPEVWGAGKISNGWSAANPNHQRGYCGIVSRTDKSVVLQTFVYEVWDIAGSYVGWLPTTAENATCGYAVLGTRCTPPIFGSWEIPENCTFTGSATAPGNVIVKENVGLTIGENSALDIDFLNHYLWVDKGGKVVIKQ